MASTIKPRMMAAADALALPIGAAVRLTVESLGTDHRGTERAYGVGMVATIGKGGTAAAPNCITVIIGPPDRAIVNVFDEGEFGAPGFPFTRDALADLIAAAWRYGDAMDDPNADGSGDGARAPNGDDYCALFDLIEQAADATIQRYVGEA